MRIGGGGGEGGGRGGGVGGGRERGGEGRRGGERKGRKRGGGERREGVATAESGRLSQPLISPVTTGPDRSHRSPSNFIICNCLSGAVWTRRERANAGIAIMKRAGMRSSALLIVARSRSRTRRLIVKRMSPSRQPQLICAVVLLPGKVAEALFTVNSMKLFVNGKPQPV